MSKLFFLERPQRNLLFHVLLPLPDPEPGSLGTHVIRSASPCGVTVHGYGGYKAYGYPGSSSTAGFEILRGEDPETLLSYDVASSSPWFDHEGTLRGHPSPLLFYRLVGPDSIILSSDRTNNRVRIDF